jgi:hypothetical protein
MPQGAAGPACWSGFSESRNSVALVIPSYQCVAERVVWSTSRPFGRDTTNREEPQHESGHHPRHRQLRHITHGLFVEVWRDYGESEEYLARDLGLDRDRLTAEMCVLWGRAFHVERDTIAGAGVTKQKRGQVARTLKAQLKAVLDGDN